MKRRTSVIAYNKIKEDGLLSDLRWLVYHHLFENGPMTAGELWSTKFKHTRQRSSISARMSELESMGVVYAAEERHCLYTGNKAIAWDVTERLPKKLEVLRRKGCPYCGRGMREVSKAS